MFVDVWSMDELMTRVGPISKSAALKALLTWVDKGVLKEEGDGSFKLLEVAETFQPVDPSRLGTPTSSEAIIEVLTSLQQL